MLGATLDSIAGCDPPDRGVEVLVVDNASFDSTAAVVTARQASYPFPLGYFCEPRIGKSHALNTGLAAARAGIILFTDDDVTVPAHWMRTCCAALDAHPEVEYVGGPVRPIWGAAPPQWFPSANSNLWGTVAVLDYGSMPFVFEDRGVVPLGVNMAVRRRAIAAVGGFNPHFGRTGVSLLGQEQAEFFCRTRAAGMRGLYVPDMWLYHHVPAERLTRQYFRRWWFWKGISRARLNRIHPETATVPGPDARPTVAGVPRDVIGEAARRTVGLIRHLGTNRAKAAEHEMFLAYLAGYAVEWRRGRRAESGDSPAPIHQATATFSEHSDRIG